jgi:hypothetical protein
MLLVSEDLFGDKFSAVARFKRFAEGLSKARSAS